ncbi:protein Lines-like protein [Platysternon megacephalum]|uniref:Protein Lines-like protein n=1 Tax=Platysternon megacephalum TaxID=55544 RepID=A0A4D9EVR7_9SAUR|nr:protein Lines-like protein [Platysternon megacephalum]
MDMHTRTGKYGHPPTNVCLSPTPTEMCPAHQHACAHTNTQAGVHNPISASAPFFTPSSTGSDSRRMELTTAPLPSGGSLPRGCSRTVSPLPGSLIRLPKEPTQRLLLTAVGTGWDADTGVNQERSR